MGDIFISGECTGTAVLCFKVLINTWLILHMSPIFFYVSD